MSFRRVNPVQWCVLTLCALLTVQLRAEDPKPTPENTITIQLAEPVKPQTFPRPLKFFLVDVIDRSGNAQPMLVFKPRGGIFLDRTPAEITRAGLEACLKSANMLASDHDSADFLLTVYLFNFGLSDSSGMDFFGKVEFAATVKNPRTAKSQEVAASGTSIAGVAIRKKNIQKNIQEDIERAFADALRNLLRGVKLRDAVIALDLPADTPATPAQAPSAAPAPTATEKPSATGMSNHLEFERRKQ
jgi:hypothetical protein